MKQQVKNRFVLEAEENDLEGCGMRIARPAWQIPDGVTDGCHSILQFDGVHKQGNHRKMKFWPTYYTPFHEGWDGKQIPCINGDESGMSDGADRPSTEGAGVFPDVYYPPCHYANPVTGKPVNVSQLNAKAVAETKPPNCGGKMPGAAAKTQVK